MKTGGIAKAKIRSRDTKERTVCVRARRGGGGAHLELNSVSTLHWLCAYIPSLAESQAVHQGELDAQGLRIRV